MEENYLKIDMIPDNTNYWLIRTNGGSWYKDFKYNNHVSITNNIVDLNTLKGFNKLDDYKKIITSKNDNNQKELKENLSNLSEDERDKILEKNNLTKRNITDLSKRLFEFIHEINIGDYILIPNYRSFEFSIGIIVSNAIEYTDKEIQNIKIDSKKKDYKYSKNKLNRKVKWLKKCSRYRIDPKILNKLQMHQTIINLSEYKEAINYLINPVYIQNNHLHINIDIKRKEDISPQLWFEFNNLIKMYTEITSFEFKSQKIDVQSPGLIEFISHIPFDFIKEIYSKNEGVFNVSSWVANVILFYQLFKGKKIKSIGGIEFQEKVPNDIKELRNDVEREKLKTDILKYQYDRIQMEESMRTFYQKINASDKNILEIPEKFESEIKNEDESVSQNDSDNN
ncbi:hypothetical protein NRV65_001457 [Staphylococcus pseudintermedius]|nr:hypothetical protein [Staphylococcus pseudintermedius]EJN7255893.1 hypothetical protein [Staphylococcus pseudintermedius]HAR6532760.1 hypothetical protein [Staphylococcus pseudintermedius]